MVRIPRPLSARTRILAAVLAVACVGLTLVGSVTFLVQREMVLSEIDERLQTQAASLLSVAESEDDVAQIDDFATVEEFLRAAMDRTVPSRNEAALAVLDGTTLIGPGGASGIDISGDDALIARVLSRVDRGAPVAPTTATR